MPARKPLVIDDEIERLPNGDFVDLGKLNIGPSRLVSVTGSTIVIPFASWIRLEYLGPGTQNIDNILVGERGDILVIHRTALSNNVRIRKGNGNVEGGPNRLFNDPFDMLVLLRRNTVWVELAWQG